MIRPFTARERRLLGYQLGVVAWVLKHLPPQALRGLVARAGSPEDAAQVVWLELCKIMARKEVRTGRPSRFVLSELLAVLTRKARLRADRTFRLHLNGTEPAPEAPCRVEVADLLAALPHRQAECLRRHYLEGESQSDIARSLGVTQRAVWAAIGRGLGNLRKELAA